MIYRNRDTAVKQKLMLFICLCMIFVAFIGLRLDDISSILNGDMYKNTLDNEIPIALESSGGDTKEISFLSKIIYDGFIRELNLFNLEVFALGDGEKDHISGNTFYPDKVAENKNDFQLDYGIYNVGNIKVEKKYKQGNEVAEVFNSSIIYNYPSIKPQVVIYHTHPGEAHGKMGPENRDNSTNVVGIGEELTKQLRDYGINVIHDTTLHDSDYNKSYVNSGKTVEKYLSKYGNVDLFLDMHIDSHNNKPLVTATMNGKKAAKFMFVFSDNAKNYQNDFHVASSLLHIARGLYPGMLTQRDWGLGEFHYKKGKESFNQLESKSVVLVEVGADCNTLEEGMETPQYLARIIAEYLYDKYTEV